MTIDVGGGTQVGSGITLAGGNPTLPTVPAYTPAFTSFVPTPPAYPTPQTGYTVNNGTTNYSVVLTGNTGSDYDAATVATPPANGTVTISGTSIYYTPNSTYAGGDSFTLTLSAGGATQTVTVNLTVLAAVPNYTATQSFTVNRNGSAGIILTGNSGAGTAYTSVTVFTQPSHGTVSITKPASIIYIVYNPSVNYTGADSFVLTLTNSGGSQNVTVNMTVAAQLTAVNSVTSLALDSGVAFYATDPSYPMTGVTGGQPPYYYYFTSNLTPTSNILGLTANGTTGAISGTPTIVSTANVKVEVVDSGGGTDPNPTGYVKITVVPRITATANTAIPTLAVGGTLTAFEFLTVSGGVPPYYFGYNGAGSIPPGLTWTSGVAGNGILSGIPTTAGTYNATFSVSDSARVSTTATTTSTINFTVNSQLTFTPGTYSTTNMPLVAGVPFTYSPFASVTGGVPPYRYSVDSPLPAGASLNTTTGVLLGTPTTSGSIGSSSIRVQDSLGTYATWIRPSDGIPFTYVTWVYSIQGITATASTTVQSLTQNTSITAFQPLTAAGGTTPYVYSVTPALPTGLSLNTTTGQVTGTPTIISSATNYTFSVKDTNNLAASTTSTVSIAVTADTSPYTINYLVVAGGGSGGHYSGGSYSSGGGGGGGGVVTGSYTQSPGTVLTITVGAGGVANCSGNNGSNSSLTGATTAIGGGGGGGLTSAGAIVHATGNPGGSGGGGMATVSSPASPAYAAYHSAPYGFAGGAGTAGQGYLGAYSAYTNSGGGGGGAGGTGWGASPTSPTTTPTGVPTGPFGGPGVTWPYSGVTYGGGGDGAAKAGPPPARTSPYTNPSGGGYYLQSGATNRGGGGGAQYLGNGAGGSGVVILAVPTPRYPGSAAGAVVTCSPTPGYKLIKFTSSGTYTV